MPPRARWSPATTQDNNLVTSPITAVCSTCHDTTTAIAHMEANGGSFYDPRSAAVTQNRAVPGVPCQRQDSGYQRSP